MADHCIKCGVPLTPDDVGIHKKLVNRGADTFLCKKCLAEHFDITVEDIDTMIERFRAQGCRLFR